MVMTSKTTFVVAVMVADNNSYFDNEENDDDISDSYFNQRQAPHRWNERCSA